MPWHLIIAFFVLGMALLIKHLFAEIIEEEHAFVSIVGVFLIIYVAAALTMSMLMPRMSAIPTVVQASE
ncbi:MAG: hypothetical protein AAB879_00625 [Patescibacteria group bacterium]